MKRLLLIVLLLSPILSFAQNVRGRISDAENRQPLAGVLISNADGQEVRSDKEGLFSLNCSAEIRISHPDFITQTVEIDDCNQFYEIALLASSEELPMVEVSAPRKASYQESQALQNLDPRELQMGKGLFMDEAINTHVPGVNMWRRTVSGGQQFNIRGYGNGVGFRGASNNFNTQGTKVYLNGIPLTNAEGLTVLDDIDFASISAVNIQKGPAGSKYGFAIAGAINLSILPAKEGESYVQQSAIIGEFGLQRYTTTIARGTENGSWLLNYGHQKADGYMEHTASRKDFVNWVGSFRISAKQRVETYFGYSDSYDERGGELTIAQFEAGDNTGNARYIKNNAHTKVERLRFGLSNHYQFNSHWNNQTTVFGSGASSTSSSAGGWNDEQPINFGLRSDFGSSFKLAEDYLLSGHTGIEIQFQRNHALSHSMVEDSLYPSRYNIVGTLKSNQFVRNQNQVYFSQWELQMPHNWSFEAGISLSSLSIDLENRMYQNGNDLDPRYQVDYKNYWSPHIALRKSFAKKWSLFASYNRSYKTPLSGNIIIGATGELNTDLVPESGSQFEIGAQGNLLNGRLNFQIAAFSTLFRNKMTSLAVPLDSVTTAYTYLINAGGQDNQGLEASVRYEIIGSKNRIFKHVQPWANVTANDFVYRDFYYEGVPRGASQAVTEVYDGQTVAGVSPLSYNVGIDIQGTAGWYTKLSLRHQGAMNITSDGANETEAFDVLNLKAGYKVALPAGFNLHVFVGLNNKLSSRYYYMVFVNQLADAYLPAPDRLNSYGGIELRYNF